MPRMVREANEARTSSAVTSMMTARARELPTASARSSRSWTSASSLSAACMEAMRTSPCLRIGTVTFASTMPRLGGPRRPGVFREDDPVAQQTLGLLDASLEVAHRVELGQVEPEPDERLRHVGGEAGHDHGR